MRERRATNSGVFRQIARRSLSPTQVAQNLPPCGVGNRLVRFLYRQFAPAPHLKHLIFRFALVSLPKVGATWLNQYIDPLRILQVATIASIFQYLLKYSRLLAVKKQGANRTR